jgi:hypothetical protein
MNWITFGDADRTDAGVEPPPLDPLLAANASRLALAIRNALETIHGEGIEHSLTDEQMRRVNPIIRDALATVLHAMSNPSRASRLYLEFIEDVPAYWEPPALLAGYVDVWRRYADPDRVCRRCGRPIVNQSGRWTHRGPDGRKWRGCRAASWTEADGWDDDLPRSWTAAPT